MLINFGNMVFSGSGIYYSDNFSMVGANSALATVAGISGTPGGTFAIEGSNDKLVWYAGTGGTPSIPALGGSAKLDETNFGFAYARVKFSPTAAGVVSLDVNTYSR